MSGRSTIHALFALGLSWALVASAATAQEGSDDELPPELASAIDPELLGGSRSEEPELPDEPARVFATLGGGAAVRLIQYDELRQDVLAPFFLDVYGAYVFPGSGVLRHGIGLGVGLGLTEDGPQRSGVGAGEQIVVTPTYHMDLRPSEDAVPDLSVYAKVGLPVAVNPDIVPGLEVAAGGAYMMLAGLGLYLEIGVSAFLGGGARSPDGSKVSIQPLVSAELGLLIDWEVLP